MNQFKDKQFLSSFIMFSIPFALVFNSVIFGILFGYAFAQAFYSSGKDSWSTILELYSTCHLRWLAIM